MDPCRTPALRATLVQRTLSIETSCLQWERKLSNILKNGPRKPILYLKTTQAHWINSDSDPEVLYFWALEMWKFNLGTFEICFSSNPVNGTRLCSMPKVFPRRGLASLDEAGTNLVKTSPDLNSTFKAVAVSQSDYIHWARAALEGMFIVPSSHCCQRWLS